MKIVALYYTHKPGGMCSRLYRLLNAISQTENSIFYLTLDRPPALLNESVSYQQIPFPFKRRRGLIFWGIFSLWCPIYVLIWSARNKPDRLIAFGAYYSTMFGPARLVLKTPIFLFLRSLVFKIDEINKRPIWLRKITGLVDKLGIKLAGTIVCMTEAMKTELENFIGKKLNNVVLLPNDIPEISNNSKTLELDLSEDTFVLGTSGVIDRRKNIGYLIETFEKIKDSSKELVLIVAGDGPLLEHYKDEAAKRNISNILFLGWMDDLIAFYNSCNLIVHPSLHEGIPNSVLEPLSLGIPVLTSSIPELKEIMQSEELLFNLNNSSALADKLGELLSDQQKLSKLTSLCNEVAERHKFDWDSKACDIVLN